MQSPLNFHNSRNHPAEADVPVSPYVPFCPLWNRSSCSTDFILMNDPLPLVWPFPSRSSSVSSRSSLAHLYSAGFPHIMDSSGQVAEVLDPTEPVPFDPQCEETDLLQDNLLVFQFLAFTRWGSSDWVTRRSVATVDWCSDSMLSGLGSPK